jgi:hypothetical protein
MGKHLALLARRGEEKRKVGTLSPHDLCRHGCFTNKETFVTIPQEQLGFLVSDHFK